MNSASDPIELVRDVNAVQIPNGTNICLTQGTEVLITQSLGGTYTIHVPSQGSLFHVAFKDADALGLTHEEPPSPVSKEGQSLEDGVWDVLKTCFDPEIPVNIVDLGLIYSLDISDYAAGGKFVSVKMTLTAPGCGMGPSIAADAKQKICGIPEVSDAEVEIVWEPQWAPSMISPEGKEKLGIEN